MTTDFYLTNIEPKEWVPPIHHTNNEDATFEAAAASACTPDIPEDPLQPGEVRLHSWQLFTVQDPVPQSESQHTTPVLDLRDAFHSLRLDSTKSNRSQDNSPDGRRKSAKSQ